MAQRVDNRTNILYNGQKQTNVHLDLRRLPKINYLHEVTVTGHNSCALRTYPRPVTVTLGTYFCKRPLQPCGAVFGA